MKTNIDNFDTAEIASPCVRNCCLDESDICMGCGRHINEILAWHQATSDERKRIIELSAHRLENRTTRYVRKDT